MKTLVYLFLASLMLTPQASFASVEQKVCAVYFKKNMNVEKMRSTIDEFNCEKGDVLYIRAEKNMMGIAAHVCVLETLISDRSGILCEYRGEVREGRRTEDYDLRFFKKDG